MRITLTVLIGLFTASCAASPGGATAPPQAWWVSHTFLPADGKGNLEPKLIGADIVLAHVLSETELAKVVDKDVLRRDLIGANVDFSLISDVDGDGQRDVVTVGVYRTKNGAIGRFLMLEFETETYRSLRVLRLPGEAKFSALRVVEGALYWYPCMYCGNRYEVRFDKGRPFIF